MTTKADETPEKTEEPYAERPMCECSHGSPDGVGVACEDAAEFEVTVLCPDDTCTALYLLCRECRAQWARSLPPPHRLLVRKLSRGAAPW